MHMHIATFIGAAAAVLTLLGAASGVVYSVGKFVASVVASVHENTRATERLTASFDKHADKVDARLDDHDTRITVVETKLKIK